MRGVTFWLLAFQFAIIVPTTAYPFIDKLDYSRFSSEAEKAKFDTLKRDQSEVLNAHTRDAGKTAGPKLEFRIIGPKNKDGLLDLPLGGGLLNGVLQPLTGVLQSIGLPTPQIITLKEIPGDDPDHQFQPPGPTDVRGVCPTLNTLANHGYVDRSGITTFAEAANAVQTVYGCGYGVAIALSALGLLAGGDLLSGKYSIGGADSRVPNTLGPALGLDKHGVFELDGSITRQDTYFGNNANFLLKRWEEYVDTANEFGNGLFGADMQAVDNGKRYDFSQSTNPEFFAGLIWFIGANGERVFVYELLGNGTKPGVVDYASVAPFFLDEKIPENWYRRADAYNLPALFTTVIDLYLRNPRPLGGNQGSTDNFIPLDFDLGAKTPAEVGCFLLQFLFDVAPGQVSGGLLSSVLLWKGFLKGVVAPFFSDDGFFNCKLGSYITPGQNAGIDKTGSKSSSGSPVNGSYPGIGAIEPDY